MKTLIIIGAVLLAIAAVSFACYRLAQAAGMADRNLREAMRRL